ncbi:MAG: hypothetical protein LBF60_02070 [Treponema sp.]|nr:hypothetical protein [Treponema sp.]
MEQPKLKAGFMLTDLYEDYGNEGVLREYAPEYIVTRSIKPLTIGVV